MHTDQNKKPYYLKLYPGYGHSGNLVLYGHVLLNKPPTRKKYSTNPFINIVQLIKLFIVKPVEEVPVILNWRTQVIKTKTAKDGFFKFEWESDTHIAAGWHKVTVEALKNSSTKGAEKEGKFFVPHITQFAFVSDIDDTVLVSHSANIFRRLRTIFTKNPHTRRTFTDVIRHYQLLSEAHTDDGVPNPFFYVSSSEWNLYNDLTEFFRYNELPQGIFLLSGIKKWYQLLKTGITKHEGKGVRIARIMDVFPQQQFVLLGDNSQSDPEIYAAIANNFPGNIFAIYIRNIRKSHRDEAIQFMKSVANKSIYTFVFDNNQDAIDHSRRIGLI